MTPEQSERLNAKSSIGNDVWFKVKGAGGPAYRVGRIVDEVSIVVADYKHVLQKIEIGQPAEWENEEFGYRSGYYTFDAAGRRLLWGQYTQFLTASQYQRLLAQARAKGWAIDSYALNSREDR